jgi:hypothetical protein
MKRRVRRWRVSPGGAESTERTVRHDLVEVALDDPEVLPGIVGGVDTQAALRADPADAMADHLPVLRALRMARARRLARAVGPVVPDEEPR